MHCYDLIILILHLILVYAFGEKFCAKLTRCRRTEHISAATFACMGRPWLGLSVGSLMRITKVGRLCARGYPCPVRGDSLESRLLIWAHPRLGQVIYHEVVVCHAMAGVSGGHGATQGMTCKVCRVIR